MKKTIINSYNQFENFCINQYKANNTKENYYVNIDAEYDEIKKIISLYQRASTVDENHTCFISRFFLEINLKINRDEDFKNTTDIFKNIDTRIASNITLNFIIFLSGNQDINILKRFQFDIYPFFKSHSFKISSEIKFNLNNAVCFNDKIILVNDKKNFENGDITKFIKYYVNEKKDSIKHENRQKHFIFNIHYNDENIFDTTILHKYLLLCNKYKNSCNGFIINIKGGDFFKVKAFVATTLCSKIYVICNNTLIIPELDYVGKLPPAIYIENANDLMFFQKPISNKIWSKIAPQKISETNNSYRKIKPINSRTYFDEDLSAKKFWPYLRMCQKFLFEEFENNKSKAYTDLRIAAYSSKEFYDEYVKKIPFLALYLFSIYDSFYRNDLLLKFKSFCDKKNYSFKIEDFLLSKQSEQDYKTFEIYKNVKKNCDIKNLLLEYDESNLDKIQLHKTVVAEIFECISIAEGLLQILENAVLHANSGLLSLRVYSRAKGLETKKAKKENHIEYLDSIYNKKFFDFQKADFYLEVQISDLSDKSIPEKFLENLESDKTIFNKLLNNLSWDIQYFTSAKKHINTSYFFIDNFKKQKYNYGDKLTKDLQEFKQSFYKIDENLVHHYGLETFNNILNSRDGIFSVCGYNDSYDNLDYIFEKVYKNAKQFIESEENILNFIVNNNIEKLYNRIAIVQENDINCVRKKIQSDKNLSGTTYRILLPLNHSSINDHSAQIITTKSNNDISQQNKIIIVENKCQFNKNETIKSKQENINKFCEYIKSEFWLNDEKTTVLCLNLFNENYFSQNHFDDHFEEIIKGTLLFALKELKGNKDLNILPIAIVNLTPFQLIEASRIISIYYTKKASGTDYNVFKKMPIYLKCAKSSKEILFAGDDLTEVKNTVIKTAMKNGSMFEELNTIIQILNKVSNIESKSNN